MSCSSSLQMYAVQGLVIGACLGVVFALFKRISGETTNSDLQKQLIGFVRDFGITGCVVGLLYAGIKDCIS